MAVTSQSESPATPGTDGLRERGLLEMATSRRLVRRMAEVDEMRLAAQWAAVHGEPRDERDPMIHPGGDGAPSMREYALAELAMAHETHSMTARSLIADTLDLMHRLPRTWAVVSAGKCEPWVARRVAVISRPLLADAVGLVDRAVSLVIAGHAPSTVLETARAKVIEADFETHAAERERVRHERYVRLSRADEFGYRHVIARVTAGDAAWIDAMVDLVADILARTHGHDHNHHELRSVAMGWLARPVDLLKLLLENTGEANEHETGEAERPAWAPEDLAQTVERLCALPARKLASLRGHGQLFVHVTDEALRAGSGIARVEGVGPVMVEQLVELLGHADVALRPVLDLSARPKFDAYEHPETVKDQIWIQSGGDVFPFSPRTATRAQVDFDHSSPYDPDGPPGQTGPHNSGPLRRRHHRWKTHGRYRCHTAGPGRHLWQTPNGLCLLVDGSGTRRLGDDEAEVMLSAPEGVEIYLPRERLLI